MSVVLRCPTCGTTGARPAECEACHEAQVRYFCTNHQPGRWLDGSMCASCGARFGDTARRPSVSAPPAPLTARKPIALPVSAPPSTPARPAPIEVDAGVRRRRRERLPVTSEEELGTGVSAMPLWIQLLKSAVAARYAPPPGGAERERPRTGRSVGGCLMRGVLIVVFLLLALVAAVFLFGWSLLQGS
jgi:hypothetical protein